jgi:putative ATP-dependent endonuclease of OLD family
MHLATLKITNFRKLKEATLSFEPGLNILVGANNIGKTAVIDALRALLAGYEEPYARILALDEPNRVQMLKALKEMHPKIGEVVEAAVAAAGDDAAKAKELFRGMFERSQNNVQKGRFGQALAQVISDNSVSVVVPDYILQAVKHVCEESVMKSP